MRTLAGPGSRVYFTNLSKTSAQTLQSKFASFENTGDSEKQAEVSCRTLGILEIIKQEFHGSLGKVCLLDPKAEKELSPEDGDGRFQWFLFGGILGDDPPRDRTSELRVLGIPSRHLGSVQMTTDTALGVTKRVVHDKVPLDKIEYIDFPNITFNRKESVEMPFRYMVEESTREPLLPPGMRKLLHEDLNKSFDF
ncbi:hypothetical protein E1B28_006678 [Marasmius oreades]|uniref:DUF431-domain-containing protein n=1 Tax=Marasmius oreades TaxID=181124 RepID=A0A9P7UWL0_9AGAR|nr:uncharacterized protein E1B28_006678 [Marasmius oreades]KAG7095995.1 hypothetical protein E1B28_006678 [Marasmius oreades]